MSIFEPANSTRETSLCLFIVDDDAAIRESIQGIVQALDFRTECYSSAEEFLSRNANPRPGCMILDVRMEGISGLELQKQLHERGWPIQIIIVTGHGDIQMSVQAMKQGAVHFLEKPYKPDQLRTLVQTSMETAESEWTEYCQKAQTKQKIDRLSTREREVCDLLVEGRGTKEIALELGISPSTVEKHRLKIFEKLQVDSVPLLIRFVRG